MVNLSCQFINNNFESWYNLSILKDKSLKMKVLFLTLCSFFLVISGCKKSSFSISLRGSVLIIDENNQPSGNYSGVNISTENPDIASINISEKGEFYLPVLLNHSGYLILKISKPGYGTVTHHYTKVQLDSISIQGSTINDIVLLPKSTVTINSLSGTLHENNFEINFNVTLDQAKPTNGVTFFLSKNNSDVSYDNFIGNNANSRTWTVQVTSGDNVYSFCLKPRIDCNSDFLSSGDTVYLKAYGDTYSPYGNNYFDIRTGHLIFPGINTTNSLSTISFVVP
jgi:hypothetical protein